MDTSAGLCLRHSLYTVNTALVLENGVCALSLYHELYFLHSSDSGLIGIDYLDLPSLSLNIVCVHAEKLRSKKSRLVTARTGIHAMVAENAIQCVAEGTGKSLDSIQDMQDGTMNLSRRKQIN